MDKLEMEKSIKQAIRNSNRNIFEWLEKKKRGTNYLLSATEVTGLVKNWMMRALRLHINAADLKRIFRESIFIVHVNEKDNYISSVEMDMAWTHSTYKSYILAIQEILDGMYFHALRYDPIDYKHDGVTPILPNYGHPDNIDLSSIENIKF